MSAKRSIPSAVCLAALLAFACAPVCGQGSRAAADPARIYELCRKLASPEFGGRLTGDEGYTAAARWMADRFKEWGLKPFPATGGYLLGYPTQYTVVESAGLSVFGSGGAPETLIEPGQDFLPLLFSDSGDRTAEAVFAGWGISAPALGYDDYAGVEVSGKFVLCFRGTPDSREPGFVDHDQHRTRMKTAHTRGALGIVYIYPQAISNPNGDWIEGFTPVVISEKIADKILANRGVPSETLRKDLEKYRRPISFATGTRMRIAVKSRHVPVGTGYNVAGWLEGADPSLRGEYVVVGAHADHCGTHAGIRFPGANDNASGTAAVMEIARLFTHDPNRPARSVAFVLFGGEEAGLKGSEYFVSRLSDYPGKAAAMINFDMVGAGDGMNCGYSGAVPALETIVREADAQVGTLRSVRAIRGLGVRGSDYAPFFARGIPCVSFASNGPHLEYHMAGDTIYRINPDILADAARLGWATARRLASASALPKASGTPNRTNP